MKFYFHSCSFDTSLCDGNDIFYYRNFQLPIFLRPWDYLMVLRTLFDDSSVEVVWNKFEISFRVLVSCQLLPSLSVHGLQEWES